VENISVVQRRPRNTTISRSFTKFRAVHRVARDATRVTTDRRALDPRSIHGILLQALAHFARLHSRIVPDRNEMNRHRVIAVQAAELQSTCRSGSCRRARDLLGNEVAHMML
jgi:hypothetical protein